MIRQKNKTLNITKALVIVFFIVAVLVPLARLMVSLKDADIQKIFRNPLVIPSIRNSLCVSVCATLISVTLALLLAWCMTRTNVRFKGVFQTLLLLPMLIPSISHGMGLIILFGTNGRLSHMFGLEQGIYGFWGIVVGSVMYSFPVAYLMLSDILRYEDSTPYEAASVLGISKVRRFTAITLPYLRKPMINVVFATFTMIVTDYGVPVMVGGQYKTLPALMYEEVIGRLDFTKGSVFGMILLIPAVIAFVVDRLCRSRGANSFVMRPFVLKRSPLRDVFSFLVLALASFAVTYPTFSFAQLTFAKRYPRDMSFTLYNIESSIGKGALGYLANSLLIALFVATLGTAVTFICAYYSVRMPSRTSSFIHMMSITSLAVPGIVLGLSYAMVFKGSFIYGTLAIIVLVNIIHFFSSPYLMMYNSFGKLNMNLESVGATLGIGRLRMIKDVFIPQTFGTLLEMFSYFFVNSMMTISAVAFLSVEKTRPVSLMISQFEGQMLLEAAAFVSLLILVVNLLMKAIIFILKSVFEKRKNNVNEKAI